MILAVMVVFFRLWLYVYEDLNPHENYCELFEFDVGLVECGDI
jgi:hypothetical protein